LLGLLGYLMLTSLRLAWVKRSKHGVSPGSSPSAGLGRSWPMPGIHFISHQKTKSRSKQAQTQGFTLFLFFDHLLIEWFAPLEVIVSPHAARQSLSTYHKSGAVHQPAKKQESITSDFPKVPSQTSTIEYYWSTATSVQPTAPHITLEPFSKPETRY
jgi:hypothetical protein